MKRIVSILLLLFSFAAPASAQEQPDEKRSEIFEVSSKPNVGSAYAILLTPVESTAVIEGVQPARMSAEIRDVKIESAGDEKWRFTVLLNPADYRTGSKLTVVATTVDGGALPSEVRLLGRSYTATSVTPVCQEQQDTKEIDKLLALNETDLDSLIRERKEKLSLREKELREHLTPAVLSRLAELEDALGLHYTDSINPDMPLPTLAFRIGALDAFRKRSLGNVSSKGE